MAADNSRDAGAVVAVCQEPSLGRHGGVAEPPGRVAPEAEGQVPVKDGLAAVAVHVGVEDLHPSIIVAKKKRKQKQKRGKERNERRERKKAGKHARNDESGGVGHRRVPSVGGYGKVVWGGRAGGGRGSTRGSTRMRFEASPS